MTTIRASLKFIVHVEAIEDWFGTLPERHKIMKAQKRQDFFLISHKLIASELQNVKQLHSYLTNLW